jgi:beta-lactamase regulating signal transducer with metallopeptidase domain
MQNLFFLSEATANALGWTLIHSLWQGTVVALATAAILWGLRHRAAVVRYHVAYAALMGLLSWVIFTFFQFYTPPKASNTEGGILDVPDTQIVVLETIQVSDNQSIITDFLSNAQLFFNDHLNSVVVAWIVGFLFLGSRLVVGWFLLRGHQRRGGNALDVIWQEKLHHFQRQLSLSRPIQLVEAAWVQVPLTIGWLRPMIFLPIGIVNRLNPTEVEAIVAHELAHIAERDYLFNFLQAIVEVILYYHPAVWWLSSVIRHERELRCDDTAIQLCGGNRVAYAKMLVALQEQFEAIPAPTPRLALTLGKRPSPLFRRIKRLFSSPTKQSTVMEKMIITGLLLCGLVVFSYSKNIENTEGGISTSETTEIQDFSTQNPAETTIGDAANSVLSTDSAKIAKDTEGVSLPITQTDWTATLAKNWAEMGNNNSSTIDFPVSTFQTQQNGALKEIVPPRFGLIQSDSMPKKNAVEKVFIPENGTFREVTYLGVSQEQFDAKQRENAKTGKHGYIHVSEFRKNDEQWHTVVRSRMFRKVDTVYMDTLQWGKNRSNIKVNLSKDDPMLTENDPKFMAFVNALIEDGLLKNPKEYSFSIGRKGMKVDDELMEKAYFDKYVALYKKHYAPQLKVESDFGFSIFRRPETPSNRDPNEKDFPKDPKEGHCYGKSSVNGKAEWQEIVCQSKVNTAFVKNLSDKLKAIGQLDNAVETTEITKSIRDALVAYQTKHGLPIGGLNVATMNHLGVNF